MPLHSDSLRLHLGRGPATPRSLQEKLGLSQPTLSRALGRLADDVVRLGAARPDPFSICCEIAAAALPTCRCTGSTPTAGSAAWVC